MFAFSACYFRVLASNSSSFLLQQYFQIIYQYRKTKHTKPSWIFPDSTSIIDNFILGFAMFACS